MDAATIYARREATLAILERDGWPFTWHRLDYYPACGLEAEIEIAGRHYRCALYEVDIPTERKDDPAWATTAFTLTMGKALLIAGVKERIGTRMAGQHAPLLDAWLTEHDLATPQKDRPFGA